MVDRNRPRPKPYFQIPDEPKPPYTCALCEKVSNEHGYWMSVDALSQKSGKHLMHREICLECIRIIGLGIIEYPEVYLPQLD
jgi:hypothetical protein